MCSENLHTILKRLLADIEESKCLSHVACIYLITCL